MTGLKHCPFCGGEASIDIIDLPDEKCYSVYCGNAGCDMYVATYEYRGSEAEAVEAWNTRHVETCHDKNGFDESLGFECTVCRTMVDSYMQTTCSDKREQFRYCPSCGRKVEGW